MSTQSIRTRGRRQTTTDDDSTQTTEPTAGSILHDLSVGNARAVLSFAGQGSPCLDELTSMLEGRPELRDFVRVASEALDSFVRTPELQDLGGHAAGLDILQWLDEPTSRPTQADLVSIPVSLPLVLLTQGVAYKRACLDGLTHADIAGNLVAATGHSQGNLAALVVAASAPGTLDVSLWTAWLRFAALLGAHIQRLAPSESLSGHATPMAAVTGLPRTDLDGLLSRINQELPPSEQLHCALQNTRTRHVVAGPQRGMAALQQLLTVQSTKAPHGPPTSWAWLEVSAPFHTPRMHEAAQLAAAQAKAARLPLVPERFRMPVLCSATLERLDLVDDLVSVVARGVVGDPVHWPNTWSLVRETVEFGHVLDIGPGDGVATLTRSLLEGRGILVHPLATPSGRASVYDAEARPAPAVDYAAFAPKIVVLANGTRRIDNHYTRHTGQSPMILPGMTPTTSDAPIVAAAANAGYTAELAGGGQVTERILRTRFEELSERLDPGQEVVFNALYLDRYLWDLHLGKQGIVRRLRQEGAAIRGVTISAGIPPVEEAVQLLDQLAALDMHHNAFKPGTRAQVDQVVDIAKAASGHTVFVHLEGGRAGGHHSWQGLEELLLYAYPRLRRQPNIVLCIGGGVADPACAADFLTGEWSRAHGMPAMPVDAILLGTVTMAALEAKTSRAVKEALVRAAGTAEWVQPGTVVGDITSGRSDLNADIHYLDNAAARCGTMLDEIAGDAEAIAARREEIIEALNATAKPYFGELTTMSWLDVLQRMVDTMAVGRGDRYEDGRWLDVTYRARMIDVLHRAEARCAAAEEGEITSVLADASELDSPEDVLRSLVAAYPDVADRRLLPQDIHWFVRQVCARPGKPVPFVPVIDADVRRWYKSDSLWQAHDDRFEAGQVLTLPGPAAVRGIERIDEPIAELLARFEHGTLARIEGQVQPKETHTLPRHRRPAPDHVKLGSDAGYLALTATAQAHPMAWCDTIAREFSGPIAALLGQARIQDGRARIVNPLRALLAASPDATLLVANGPRNRALDVTWYGPQRLERVHISSDSDHVTAELHTCDDKIGTLRFHRQWHPSGRVFILDSQSQLETLRGLYGTSTARPFEPFVSRVTEDADRLAAWRTAISATGEATHADRAFALAWRAIDGVLTSEALVDDLFQLVHLSHEVDVHDGWNQLGEHAVRCGATLTRIDDDATGRTLTVEVDLHTDDRRIATLTETFRIRRPVKAPASSSHTLIEGKLTLDATDSDWLAAQAWLHAATPLQPGSYTLCTTIHTSGARDQARRHQATGVLTQEGQTIATIQLDDTRTGHHPVEAALALLHIDTVDRHSRGEPVNKPRRTLAQVTTTAPRRLDAYARAGGDHNPIHRSDIVARLAGLESPIVHGMWTSARMQSFAVAHLAGDDAARLDHWQVQFLDMVLPGETLELQAQRTGLLDGDLYVEVTASVCRDDSDIVVAKAHARILAPRTVLVFPGQGIQQLGMGMSAYASSAAARRVWDAADRHTRAHLGFSVLRIVRDNPKEIIVHGERFRHPEGVLHLTRFTQVSMAVLAFAQVESLRDAGALNPHALSAGHSIGEYNALGAYFRVLALEDVLDLVYTRGTSMEALVPRDADGRSEYAMAVVRPHAVAMNQTGLEQLVAEVASETGLPVQIANYNARDRQYAVAGHRQALAQLGAVLDARRAPDAPPAWLLVPGIDVPFHTKALTPGVTPFRQMLERVITEDIDWRPLVGRYIPNLVALPFQLERDFVAAAVAATDAPAFREMLEDYEQWAQEPDRMARVLLIELLAWQFASPVRWVETQELLFTPAHAGGLGVRQLIEIGVGYQPTLRNLAGRALKYWPGFLKPDVSLFNVEADAERVLQQDEEAAPTPAPAAPAAEIVTPTPEVTPVAATVEAADEGVIEGHAMSIDAAMRTLLALQCGRRPESLDPSDTIDDLFEGVSSRRNQALLDLGAEFSVGTIDGAHERPLSALADELARRCPRYVAPGPYLAASRDHALKALVGPTGATVASLGERLEKHWGLGAPLQTAVLIQLAIEAKHGAQPASSMKDLDETLQTAVSAISATIGRSLPRRQAKASAGAAIDSAALHALRDELAGAGGALMGAARALVEGLGHSWPIDGALPTEPTEDEARLAVLDAELGTDFSDHVAPRFDPQHHVVMDDIWALARRDLVALAWAALRGDLDDAHVTQEARRLSRHSSDAAFRDTARWFAARARDADHTTLAEALDALTRDHTPQEPTVSPWAELLDQVPDTPAMASVREAMAQGLGTSWDFSNRTALITGAAPGSIAWAIARFLLRGGATVVMTASRVHDARVRAVRHLYRTEAAPGAVLHLVPFNQASKVDATKLTDWLFDRVTEPAGGSIRVLKESMAPDLLIPFAAQGAGGTLDTLDTAADTAFRSMVHGVERLIGGIATRYRQQGVSRERLHVILPLSPNHGDFGGDGMYGEAKSALEVLPTRWKSENNTWGHTTSLVATTIGWVRGTGLMHGNDPVAHGLEADTGVRTFSSEEMGWMIAALCTDPVRLAARIAPVRADLSGGMGKIDNLLEAVQAVRSRVASTRAATERVARLDAATQIDEVPRPTLAALADPTRTSRRKPTAWNRETNVDLSRVVVIVGAGEVGPCGTSRTRFDLELDRPLPASTVHELAWLTGLVRWEAENQGGQWTDIETGEVVPEHEITERYRDVVRERVGVRWVNPEITGFNPLDTPVYDNVFLDRDLTFAVSTQAEAEAFQANDPERTDIARREDGTWQVIRRKGSAIRVARRAQAGRKIAGQLPTGFDPRRAGISDDMAQHVDRITLLNLIATADAFDSAGLTPEELMSHVHPARVGNTQGTGIGGTQSLERLYLDHTMGRARQSDILQESLGNVIAGWAVQSYIGSYGPMSHPVGACATAAVSIEDGVDKILAGKADVIVAGGYDDIGGPGSLGFADMHATADSDLTSAMGLEPSQVSRANDVRRRGFVEAQGGGTMLLARADVAVEMGLPVLAVVGWAGSFGDGIHRSIPAPGMGVLSAAGGGATSPIGRALAPWGLTADDIAVVSKHDTSTAANDPNESDLHHRMQRALGRTPGNPLLVVSQKTVTGHAKGGAAAWQAIGLTQIMASGRIPGNRNLTCVDPKMRAFDTLVFNDAELEAPASQPLRAGLLTSLGFGHVNSLVLVIHPDALLAAIPEDARETYIARRTARQDKASRTNLEVMLGQRARYTARTNRRFDAADGTKQQAEQEAEMLLNTSARLTPGAWAYRAPKA